MTGRIGAPVHCILPIRSQLSMVLTISRSYIIFQSTSYTIKRPVHRMSGQCLVSSCLLVSASPRLGDVCTFVGMNPSIDNHVTYLLKFYSAARDPTFDGFLTSKREIICCYHTCSLSCIVVVTGVCPARHF